MKVKDSKSMKKCDRAGAPSELGSAAAFARAKLTLSGTVGSVQSSWDLDIISWTLSVKNDPNPLYPAAVDDMVAAASELRRGN